MARKKENPFKKEQPIFVRPGLLDAPTGGGLTKGDELLRRLRFEFDYDPLRELVDLAKGMDSSTGEKIRIAETILSYYQPKVKAMDFNPNAGETIKLNITFPEREVLPGFEHAVNSEENKVENNADKLRSPSNICEGAQGS